MRKKINLVLIVLYVSFYLAIPSLIMSYSFFFDDYAIQTNWFASLVAVMSIFTLLIFIFYSTIIFKYHAEKSTLKALIIFIPLIINKILYFYDYSSLSHIERIVILDSIPFYLGIYTSILIGLIVLVASAIKREGFKKLKIGLVALAILLPFFYIPYVYFFILGWYLAVDYSNETETIAIIKYLLSISLIVFFHYRMTILYLKQGVFEKKNNK